MTSLYDAGRDQEHLTRLKIAIDTFAWQYLCDARPDKKLIFLFPGGMASELLRATTSSTSPAPYSYYVSWLSGFILVGEANNLRIELNDDDYHDNYVIPDHEIGIQQFGLGLSSYGCFKEWCFKNRIHLFVFGWDWRRGVQHSVDFFLNTALPAFEAKIGTLKNFTLIGHSAGGMVVKVIANQKTNAYVQRMDKAITVGAPFYGYGTQIQRFFKGVSVLNATVPGHTREMAQICATMLGGYEYMLLDEVTYNANAADFQASSEPYKLLNYPSVDFTNPNERADPFNPIGAFPLVRYPTAYTGFSDELDA
jgi:pimeloyl-ACP methyl ester carboxylesterase